MVVVVALRAAVVPAVRVLMALAAILKVEVRHPEGLKGRAAALTANAIDWTEAVCCA